MKNWQSDKSAACSFEASNNTSATEKGYISWKVKMFQNQIASELSYTSAVFNIQD